jgi:hypothetical protein
LIKTNFTLPFVGKNFFRGIVINEELPSGKDAVADLVPAMQCGQGKPVEPGMILIIFVKVAATTDSGSYRLRQRWRYAPLSAGQSPGPAGSLAAGTGPRPPLQIV